VRAHHDAAGIHVDLDVLGALEKAADEQRNTVERLTNELNAWRGIATRFDAGPRSTSPASAFAPR
jgi:transposase